MSHVRLRAPSQDQRAVGGEYATDSAKVASSAQCLSLGATGNSMGIDPEKGVGLQVAKSSLTGQIRLIFMSLEGEPVMMLDQNKRALVIEAVIAGGLITIGITTGQPLIALASSVAGVGGNWAHNLAQRGFQRWRDRWFTDHCALTHDIAKVL